MRWPPTSMITHRQLCIAAFVLLSCSGLLAQVATAPAPSAASKIPVHYDESKFGTSTCPIRSSSKSSQPVRDPRTWMERRRPEILHLFEENVYGRCAARI